MQIIVNGEKKEIEKELNLHELLKRLALPTERVAIELNKTVVRKKDWEAVKIADSDKIEVIHFVGGG
jgi:thiamine biosynthesis protein ThiS